MGRSSIFYLSSILLFLGACEQRDWYNKELSADVMKQYSPQLRAGRGFYYQGSVPEQFQNKEAMLLDSTDADLWREFGTARVKRGILDEMDYYYGKAVDLKPEGWAGFRGYLYLYFYRDFQRAIDGFNLGDEVVGEVDYSQGQNHEYMRGICYYGLEDYDQAISSFSSYISSTTASDGAEWVDVYAHLYNGLAYIQKGEFEQALLEFDKAEKIYPKLSDLFYHRARIALNQGRIADAERLLQTAREYFQEGYYHQRPYVEVLEQIYIQDIDKLEKEIADLS